MESNNISPFFAVHTMTPQKMLSTSIKKQDLIKEKSYDILLVDDNPNILASISAYLEKKGSSITKASDGRAALEAIKKNCFDLVITDLNMPRLKNLAQSRAGIHAGACV